MVRPNYGVKRRIRPDGYVDVWEPEHPLARRDGYLMEHRKIAYDAGLLVDSRMQIHHVNHDKQDNRLSNLHVVDIAEHARQHADEGLIHNQHGVWVTGTGFVRRHQAWLTELGDRHCEVCGRDINGLRLDATVCGNSCRIKRWKRGRRLGLR
jgi:hypothetical protein